MKLGRDEIWDILKELGKKNHTERVVKTPSRIEYCKVIFDNKKIKYELKNAEIGHFHIWDKNGKLYQFWCSTGKIMGAENRGVKNLLKLELR